ncbi:phospholipase D family protein [Massilia niastensis]|uniref:phospholipase D family protein n=1 Tax=Massilia niastensis TaxID=544911 RepID=UPI001E5F930B|nr:phospholipase D family protein [Massilia niastensis]
MVASKVDSLPALNRRAASVAVTGTDDTYLGRCIVPLTVAHPGLTGIHALQEGREAFAARALLAQHAQRSLDIQYYIWRNDTTGTLLFDELKAAAGRGVRVRLLLDDNTTSGLDAVLAELDAHPLIEVRLFNPFAIRKPRALNFVTDFARVNRRMHNKSFTADNQISIVGGRNVGDEYYGAASAVLFVDLDVITVGPVVREVSNTFDRYWNSPSAYPLASIVSAAAAGAAQPTRDAALAHTYMEAVRNLPFFDQLTQGAPSFDWAPVRLLSDSPGKVTGNPGKNGIVADKLRALFGNPQRGLDLVSPYFVPGKDTANEFIGFARRGASVRVLTNSLEATDVAAVHAGYAEWRKPLLEAGVRLYELRREWAGEPGEKQAGGPGSSDSALHAKTFAVDGERLFVGSFNLDQRSMHLNTEMGVVIDSPELARRLALRLDRAIPKRAYEVRLDKDGALYWIERQEGRTLRHDVEPGTTWRKRTAVWLMSWLPIDWLL